MKSFKQFIIENPPPEDWDRSIFKKSFDKQIEYALQRATELGTGSSRVAFEIIHDGRPTVLKIAKNKKGLAQNLKEGDENIYRLFPDITIPLIDKDEVNRPPRWLHFEKAQPLSFGYFSRVLGFSFDHFCDMIDYVETSRSGTVSDAAFVLGNVPVEIQQKILDSTLYKRVIELADKFDLMLGDISAISNWGVFQDRPVLIDIGLDSTVMKTYKFKFPRFW